MAVKEVRITAVGGIGGVCTVAPSGVMLTAGSDDIIWINQTSDKVIVFVPHDDLLGDDKHFHQAIPAHGKRHFRTGPNPGTTPDHYKYAVYCLQTGNWGIGSDPEIIVQ